MSEVGLSRRAVKDLDAIEGRPLSRVMAGLRRLGEDEPSTMYVKPLVGRKPWQRLRVGEYRVLFRRIDGIVLVARVIDRKELERAVRTLPG